MLVQSYLDLISFGLKVKSVSTIRQLVNIIDLPYREGLKSFFIFRNKIDHIHANLRFRPLRYTFPFPRRKQKWHKSQWRETISCWSAPTADGEHAWHAWHWNDANFQLTTKYLHTCKLRPHLNDFTNYEWNEIWFIPSRKKHTKTSAPPTGGLTQFQTLVSILKLSISLNIGS